MMTFLLSINQYTPIVKLELNSRFNNEERTYMGSILSTLMNFSMMITDYINSKIYLDNYDTDIEPLGSFQKYIPFLFHNFFLLVFILMLFKV